MKRLILTIALILSTSIVSAQTVTFKISWDQSEALTIVQGFQYTLRVDSAPPSILTPTCATKGAGTTCSAPLPTLTSGPHTLVVTAFNGFGSTASDPLSGQPPSKPVVSVTVTVSVP